MGVAAILLLVVNIVYATSPVVTRLVLDDVPPITLALLRLVLGAAVLVPFGRGARATPAGQGARVFWMGALGFAAAFALSHWGIARSSATNAALLIVVESLTLVILGPLLLGTESGLSYRVDSNFKCSKTILRSGRPTLRRKLPRC